MPDCIGLTAAEAIDSTRAAGLRPAPAATAVDDREAEGRVVAQQPVAGATLGSGAMVELLVGALAPATGDDEAEELDTAAAEPEPPPPEPQPPEGAPHRPRNRKSRITGSREQQQPDADDANDFAAPSRSSHTEPTARQRPKRLLAIAVVGIAVALVGAVLASPHHAKPQPRERPTLRAEQRSVRNRRAAHRAPPGRSSSRRPAVHREPGKPHRPRRQAQHTTPASPRARPTVVPPRPPPRANQPDEFF